MKKTVITIFLLLFGIFLFAEKDTSISKTAVRLQLQEFAYPLIPDAGKVSVEVPLSLFVDDGIMSRTNARVWYLASSPFFIPDPFFEVGLTGEYVFAKTRTASFAAGVGTAFSMENNIISIPLIISARARWFPLRWLELEASLENLLYGEGDFLDAQAMITFKPFKIGLLFHIGGTGVMAYSWKKDLFGYSYGLSAGFGYLF